MFVYIVSCLFTSSVMFYSPMLEMGKLTFSKPQQTSNYTSVWFNICLVGLQSEIILEFDLANSQTASTNSVASLCRRGSLKFIIFGLELISTQ